MEDIRMKTNRLFTFAALYGLLNAVGALLNPQGFLGVFGLEANAAAQLSTQYFGMAVLGAAVVTWVARNTVDITTQRALLWGNVITFAVGLIVNLWGMNQGLLGAKVWFFNGLDLTLGAVFAYFLYRISK
jgi:uncharacterized membrane protein